MKASQVEKLLSNLLDLQNKEKEWINKIPKDIQSSFFDNEYVNCIRMEVDNTLEFIFGDWTEDVSLFLYENYPHIITTKKKKYVISSVTEYVDYMVNEGFVTEDREQKKV